MSDEFSERADDAPISIMALGRDAAMYAFGGLAYKGIALLSVPILARLLSPTQFGLLDLAAVVATLIGLVAVMGTDQGVALIERTTEYGADVWEAAAALVAIAALGLALACIILQQPLALLLTSDYDNRSVFAAAGVYGAVMASSAFALNAVRLRATSRAYALVSFLIVVCEMAAALAVAWLIPQPVAWMVLAWAAGASLVTVPVLVRYLPRLRRPRGGTVWRLFRFGAPLVPAAMAWLIGDAWVRSTLAREAGLAELGEYGIAYRIVSLMGLAVTGFGVAWYPYLYRSAAAAVVPRTVAAGTAVLLALSAGAVTMTGLARELVGVVAGAEYAGATVAVPTLAGGMIALGAFVLISAVVSRSGSTRRIGAAALFGTAVQVAIAIALVPGLGQVGAGLASLGGYGLAAIGLALTEARLLAGRGGFQLAVVIVAGTVGLVIAAQLSPLQLGIRLGVVVSYCALVGVLAWALRPRSIGTLEGE